MEPTEWLDYAKANRMKLAALVNGYHPAVLKIYSGKITRITAPNAEAASDVVRKNVQSTFQGNPVVQFHKALDNDDWRIVNKILNEAWFGVPESIDCWTIKGFKEAVTLMEDPPEDAA